MIEGTARTRHVRCRVRHTATGLSGRPDIRRHRPGLSRRSVLYWGILMPPT